MCWHTTSHTVYIDRTLYGCSQTIDVIHVMVLTTSSPEPVMTRRVFEAMLVDEVLGQCLSSSIASITHVTAVQVACVTVHGLLVTL